MKRKRVTFIRTATIAAILLLTCGAALAGPGMVWEAPGEALAPVHTMAGKAEGARYDYPISAAVSAEQEVTQLTSAGDWPMLAANPQRTSWTSEEIRGALHPVWYRPIEPYINYKVQVIASNGLLYISTARGLYALDAENGDTVWIYPTELPLGHSPTVVDDIVYVGGYDRKIHAINALTGEKVPTWTAYEAGAGFETNPLVINGKVYAGNRDGYMYAFDAATGDLKWRYKTGGPILFSAAFQDNTIYFASNDSYAYALDAQTGDLVWKSAKLPGAGFHSYWPVVYQDWVIFAGSNNYRVEGWTYPAFGADLQLTSQELNELYPNHKTDRHGTLIGSTGTEPGEWVDGTITINTGRPTVTENGSTKPITEYFEEKPWRRTYFVLNRFTGEELTFDSDNDGKPEYAPFAWFGTHSGNRYPPVIGGDGVLYQSNNYMSDEWIPGGQGVGWKFGTQFISLISGGWNAVDEPMAFSAGGNLVYWTNTVDREAGAYDITIPKDGSEREWLYWSYDLANRIPGYDIKYYLPPNSNRDYSRVYGNVNGIYGTHGVQNPIIPYRGKAYTQRGNSVIALGITTADPIKLPLVETVDVQPPPPRISTEQLKYQLAVEVEKILNAGHLRPGYHSTGLVDPHLETEGYQLDYWHNPADTLYTLIRALPYLSPDLQQRTRDYLQQEFAAYPPYNIAHIGWREGASREAFELPPEIEAQRSSYGPQTEWSQGWWRFPQISFYGLWKYAQVYGGAGDIFEQIRDKIETPPDDSFLFDYPQVHNAYIAGYFGYLELEKLAGEPESTEVRTELNRLLNLRATNFTKDSPFNDSFVDYRRSLNVSRNFMYLVPELADYLRDNVYDKVKEAVDEYNDVAPSWFVSKYDATYGEGTLQLLYDYHAIFQAKALILGQSREELAKYLDVPAFERGDLFYIQNLIAAIEAPYDLEKTPSATFGFKGNAISYTLNFFGSGHNLILTDTLPLGVSAPTGFELVGTTIIPTYNSDLHHLVWNDTPMIGQKVTIRYTVTITTDQPQILINTAELDKAEGKLSTVQAKVMANYYPSYLPLIQKTMGSLRCKPDNSQKEFRDSSDYCLSQTASE
jgi:outer membrane protein assembly factor BamB